MDFKDFSKINIKYILIGIAGLIIPSLFIFLPLNRMQTDLHKTEDEALRRSVSPITAEIRHSVEGLKDAATNMISSKSFHRALLKRNTSWLSVNLSPKKRDYRSYDGISIIAKNGKSLFSAGVLPPKKLMRINPVKRKQKLLPYPSISDEFTIDYINDTPLLVIEETVPSQKSGGIDGVIRLTKSLDADYFQSLGQIVGARIELLPESEIPKINWAEYKNLNDTDTDVEYFYKPRNKGEGEFVINFHNNVQKNKGMNIRVFMDLGPLANLSTPYPFIRSFLLPMILLGYLLLMYYLLKMRLEESPANLQVKDHNSGSNKDEKTIEGRTAALTRDQERLLTYDNSNTTLKETLIRIASYENFGEMMLEVLRYLSPYGFSDSGIIVRRIENEMGLSLEEIETFGFDNRPKWVDYLSTNRSTDYFRNLKAKRGETSSMRLTSVDEIITLRVFILGKFEGYTYYLISNFNKDAEPLNDDYHNLFPLTEIILPRIAAFSRISGYERSLESHKVAQKLSFTLIKGETVAEITQNFLPGICDVFGFNGCGFYIPNSQSGELICRGYFGPYERNRQYIEARDKTMVNEAVKSKDIVESDTRDGKYIKTAVPVLDDNQVSAVFLISHGDPLKDKQDRFVLDYLFHQFTRLTKLLSGIESDRLELEIKLDSLKELLQIFDIADNISQDLSRTSDFYEMLRSLSVNLKEALNLSGLYWITYEENNSKKKLKVNYYDEKLQLKQLDEDAGKDILPGRSLDNYGFFEYFSGAHQSQNYIINLLQSFGHKYIALMPIDSLSENCHLLALARNKTKGFNNYQFRLINRLSSEIRSAIHRLGASTETEAKPILLYTPERIAEEEKIHLLGEISGGIVHDFNNILASILGRVQLMLMRLKSDNTLSDEELVKNLEIVEKVTNDGGQILKRIHEFSKRTTESNLETVPIDQLISDSLDITRPRWRDQAASHGITIKIETDLVAGLYCTVNPADVRGVLTNIILNSVDAMPNGGVIRIRNYSREKFNYIEISDNGIGMTTETKERIFEPFFTTKGKKGTGLGMSITYGIIKRYGGNIYVESAPGKGAKFTITIPLVDEKPVSEDKNGGADIKETHPSKVLVIDDEEYIREVLQELLSAKGHLVELASDGEEGLAKLKKGEYDVVITDLGMPGISGWDVAKEVKDISPETKVVLATGWGSQYQGRDYKSRGVDMVVSKPFDMQAILGIVKGQNQAIIMSEENNA